VGYFFEFDAENNVFRSTTEGRVTDDTLLEVYALRQRFRASRPPYRSIIDLSGVTEVDVDVSNETINYVARKSATIAGSLLEIVVAPEDVTYGLSRMFFVSRRTKSAQHARGSQHEGGLRVAGNHIPALYLRRDGVNLPGAGRSQHLLLESFNS
jgi:hypothetical protein